VNEEALAHWGLSRQKQKDQNYFNYSALLNNILVSFSVYLKDIRSLYNYVSFFLKHSIL
jgi:hypothetical protein